MTERARMRRIVVAAAALLFSAAGARAQTQTPDSSHAGGWSFGMWGGRAHNSPTSIFGVTPGRNVALTAIRATHTLGTADWAALDYVADLVPAAWVSMREGDQPATWVCPSQPQRQCTLRPATLGQPGAAAYGVGATPFGFQLRFAPSARVQPYLATSGGMLWFDRPVPYPRTSRFNFTADAGGGVIVRGPAHLALMLGYKLHHISNGGTARLNPGLDGHMLYAGLMHLPR
jgi:hypothetical protein